MIMTMQVDTSEVGDCIMKIVVNYNFAMMIVIVMMIVIILKHDPLLLSLL